MLQSKVPVQDSAADFREFAQITLDSIGDAVISIDLAGNVTYLNRIAEAMIGWPRQAALGRPLGEVFRVVDGVHRSTLLNPMTLAIQQDRIVNLAPNSVLIRRDGCEAAIEDSIAPIHDRQGKVTGAVMVFRDVSAARAAALTLSHRAQHDSLTDLPNRVLLNDRLSQALALARRRQTKLAVLFLDVDQFKGINDSHGHTVGDLILRSVAQRLLACVRDSDTVSRHGGDEFVVLFPELTQAQDAAIGATKMLLTLRRPHRVDRRDIRLTASIGIATYPDEGAEAETLTKNADVAMYRAKGKGGNAFQFFSQELGAGRPTRSREKMRAAPGNHAK